MNSKYLYVALVAALGLLLYGCEPEPTNPANLDFTPTAFVLCEGSWGSNNASLTAVDVDEGKVLNDWFAASNGRGLGDLGQDMILAGGKLYIAVSESGSLERIDLTTGISHRLDLGNLYPRYIAADSTYLYLSCYNPHCVVRVNQLTFTLDSLLLLGDFNPEGLAMLAGQKLLVASSHISSEQGAYYYDDKVYLIDCASFSVDTTLTVGLNPNHLCPLDAHRAVVCCWGDYGSHPAKAQVVDISSMTVTDLGVALNNLCSNGQSLYGYTLQYTPDYSYREARYYQISPSTLAAEEILLDCGISNPYCIAASPNGSLFIGTDGNYTSNGILHCFSNGLQQWQAEVGMLPNKIVFAASTSH